MNHAQTAEAVTPEIVEPAARDRNVIAFPKGIPGFEGCRGFVLMAPESGNGLQYLRSVDGPAASFLVLDPRQLLEGYRCELSEGDRERLHAAPGASLLWLVLVAVEPDGAIVANLRAPIVINPERMLGAQVIPHHCLYPLRHVVVPAE
jgi:flagellar assembly factor FliW